MIPGVVIEEKEVLYKGLSLVADHSCYTGAVIKGVILGDVTVVKAKKCETYYPSNVHVCVGSTGFVAGNIYANEVIVCGGGKVTGKIVAGIVTVEPWGTVGDEIIAHYKVRRNYIQPLFLRGEEDPTITTLKKLGKRIDKQSSSPL